MTPIFIVTAVASLLMAVLFFLVPALPPQAKKLTGKTAESTSRQVVEQTQGVCV